MIFRVPMQYIRRKGTTSYKRFAQMALAKRVGCPSDWTLASSRETDFGKL